MNDFERCMAGLLSLGIGLAAAGCFDIEEKVTLKKNLSGTAALSVKVDMEPMVTVMAGMQRSMSGQPGKPTQAELAAVKTKLLAEQKSKLSEEQIEAERRKMASGLPEGVRLTRLDARMRQMVLEYQISLAYDHIEKLGAVHLGDSGKAGRPGQTNPVGQPFAGLRVSEEKGTILIEAAPPDPSQGLKGMPQVPGGGNSPVEQAIDEALGAMKVSFIIEAPFSVLESNATRVRGKTLHWEYDLAALEKMSAEGGTGIRVKFAK